MSDQSRFGASKNCHSCHKALAGDDTFCRFCGASQQAPQQSVTPPWVGIDEDESTGVPRSSSAHYCIGCGNTHVTKVAALVDGQTRHGQATYESQSLGTDLQGHLYSTTTTTTRRSSSQTPLASTLERPPKPRIKTNPWSGVNGLGVTAGALFVIAALLYTVPADITGHGPSTASFPLICAGMVFVVLAIAFFPMALRKSRENEQYLAHWVPRWESATRRWNRLFYCPKCDGLSDYEQDQFANRSDYRAFVYRAYDAEGV